MSLSNIQKTRASIKPSARACIHDDHAFCPLELSERMARLGLVGDTCYRRPVNKIRNTRPNAMSKPVNPIRPSFRPYDRRNSYQNKSAELRELQESSDSDDTVIDNENSDDSYHSVGHGSIKNMSPYSSRNNFITRNTQPFGNQLNRSGSIKKLHQKASKYPEQYQEKHGSDNMTMIIKIIMVLVSIIIAVNFYIQGNNSDKDKYDTSKFYKDMELLSTKYLIDKKDMLQVQSGLCTIFEKHDTASFIFVYNSSTQKYNHDKFNTFINNLSEKASKYLRNTTPTVQYATVKGAALNMKDHVDLIKHYQEDLDRTGVMLVRDVEAVPSHLAMAFHYYCDKYSPLVKKSAIFFTLNLAECSLATEKNSTQVSIEFCLTQKWRDVPSYSLRPLLARVVNVVIDLTSAFNN